MTVNTESNFVLLVDDNPSNLSVLSEVLTIAGIAFRVALDGKSALALADRKLPSLILLDIQMPGIDGFEVCRQLQQNPKTQAIPIIFMTAVTEVESKAQGFALGAVDYITKPFQKVEILARVKAHLRLHHLNQDLQQELKLRQQAEIKLRKSEQRYRYLYENTPVMLHSIDAEGKLISVSSYWLSQLGYERHEVLGRRSTDFLTEESQRYAIEIVLPDYFQTGVCWDIPYQVVTKTGRIFDVLLSALAERDETGQIVRSLAVMVDVTERNRAQAELLQAEKMAALGRLTAGVAHELRNPLNFVKNYAEGSIELSQELLNTLASTLPSLPSDTATDTQELITDLQQNATSIHHHSQRAEQIIEGMMQYAHTDYKQIAPQPTDLHQLLDQAVKLAIHGKPRQDRGFNLDLRTHYASDLNLIRVIPGSLMRAFINLIDNACDAMEVKQRQHQADSRQIPVYTPTLSISTQNLGEKAEIRIHDNGCGIDVAIQPKILDPFFTTKPPGKGTGLGLSLTHDIIVKQHQGIFTLNTSPGEFTEFVLTIPLR